MHIANQNDWIAVGELLSCQIIPLGLLVAARLDVGSVVLVELFQFVVYVDGTCDIFVDFYVDIT